MDWKQCFKGKKILLAEDDEVTQEMMQDIFQSMNVEIIIANDGNEVVKKFQEGEFDLILMDIWMPNKDGMKATSEIRELEKGKTPIPIIALTASVLPSEKEAVLAAGVNTILFKPINLEELRNTMYKYLGS